MKKKWKKNMRGKLKLNLNQLNIKKKIRQR
jgi:hypothetical protein